MFWIGELQRFRTYGAAGWNPVGILCVLAPLRLCVKILTSDSGAGAFKSGRGDGAGGGGDVLGDGGEQENGRLLHTQIRG